MRYRKVCEEHKVHHLDLYIRSGMSSNESDTYDSLRKDPYMQPRDDVVIRIHRNPYGCTSAHAHPVLVMTWKILRKIIFIVA